MIDMSANAHQKRSRLVTLWAWYTGTDALFQGEAVCFDEDRGTATDDNAERCNFVERPTTSNNKSFAGVAARNYSASSGPNGQLVELYAPGSKCVPVALGVDTTIGTGLITFGVAGAKGRFHTGKYRGRGSAIPRQTVTALVEASMTGGWTVDKDDGITVTVTDTTGLAAGDTVVLLGGEAEDGGGSIVAGRYTIDEVLSATQFTLTSSAISGAAVADLTATGYAYTGNPTALADLLDGEESGGVEFVSPPNAGGAGLAYMVGGVTYVCGGVTLAADSDVTFAQGSLPGDKKCFVCLGTLTTSDFTVDLVTAGIQIDGSTALAEVNAFDAAADAAFLEFNGARWFAKDLVGGATQA